MVSQHNFGRTEHKIRGSTMQPEGTQPLTYTAAASQPADEQVALINQIGGISINVTFCLAFGTGENLWTPSMCSGKGNCGS